MNHLKRDVLDYLSYFLNDPRDLLSLQSTCRAFRTKEEELPKPPPPRKNEEDDSEEEEDPPTPPSPTNKNRGNGNGNGNGSGKEAETEREKAARVKWVPLDRVWKYLSEYRWNLRLVVDRFSLLSFYEYYKQRHLLEYQISLSSAIRDQQRAFESSLLSTLRCKESEASSFRTSLQSLKETVSQLASVFSHPPDFSPSPSPSRKKTGFTPYSIIELEDESSREARVVFASNHRASFLTTSIISEYGEDEEESCSCEINVEAIGNLPEFLFCKMDPLSESREDEYQCNYVASRGEIIKRVQYLLPESAFFWEREEKEEEEEEEEEEEDEKEEEEKKKREERIALLEKVLEELKSKEGEQIKIKASYEDFSKKEREFIKTMFELDRSESEWHFWEILEERE